ncbi:50S ribosomal protein L16 3-hydroxylase [Microbulbifer aestuariivivens]|uniref:50S ribosomal protein L16 3-hydroxylase n=2 Tax=Microbulbifer aestuariivivens TaxID=1908308 RepID=A0ABP9WN25_9GAMM
MPIEQFLKEYWQQKPLLIRNAFPDFVAPISGEELAGMALEEAVESRLVLEHGDEGPWELRQGPFTEEEFLALPASHWTLLVQAVDQWVGEIADLKRYFRFLPEWRLDDVMISYAADQGSVGPHFDHYDVFLLQAEGKRLWQQGPKANDDSPRLEGTRLNILREFEAENSWLLEPGDMLYLPPQYSHWGVADGACTTISVGFRAPSARHILEDLASELAANLPEHTRYTDAGLSPVANPDEIDPEAVNRLREQLRTWIDQPQHIAQWLGAVMTEAKYPETVELDAGEASDWREQLDQGATLVLNPASRCAFTSDPGTLFVDGEALPVNTGFAMDFCAERCLTLEDVEAYPEIAAENGLIDTLVSQGTLIYPPEDF